MCDPITIALMAAGTAASFAGTGIAKREAQRNDSREADARNRVLQETLRKNDQHSADSRAAFQRRVTESMQGGADEKLQEAQTNQTTALESNLNTTGAEAPLSGDAPQVVKSTMAKSLKDSFAESMQKAKTAGKLGGYSAQSRDNAIADSSLGDTINQNNGFVRGNMGVMPYLQDYAGLKVRKPSSGLGEMIAAAGQMASSAAGSRGGGPKIFG
jgi:hypothetical protein